MIIVCVALIILLGKGTHKAYGHIKRKHQDRKRRRQDRVLDDQGCPSLSLPQSSQHARHAGMSIFSQNIYGIFPFWKNILFSYPLIKYGRDIQLIFKDYVSSPMGTPHFKNCYLYFFHILYTDS